jgi:hypothetical protein
MTENQKGKTGNAANESRGATQAVYADAKATAHISKDAGMKANESHETKPGTHKVLSADAKAATHSMHSNVATSIHQVKDAGVAAKKVSDDAKADALKADSDTNVKVHDAKPELKKK